jgi:hypothetical protein
MGLIVAGVVLFLQARLGGTHSGVADVVWWLDRALAAIACLGLVLTAARYVRYRHRRAELDAAGAEVLGEFLARHYTGPNQQ